MKRAVTVLLVSAALSACSRNVRESATARALGFPESQQAEAGPYAVHYGVNGERELVILSRGNQNVVSVDDGATSVYWHGLPFLELKNGPDGRPASLMLYVTDSDGTDLLTLIDLDVDGQWDTKIDHRERRIFEWKDARWHERPEAVKPSAH
jgi:hypothetical protein